MPAPVDPLPPSFDALEVFEELAEVAIAAGAERPALEKILERIRELKADG